jgi:phosphoglycerate dehydrogenase-like enzyme
MSCQKIEALVSGLSLAPFDAEALGALDREGVRLQVESWRDTEVLADPVELGQRLRDMDAQVLVSEADFITKETLEAAPGIRVVGVCRGNVGIHVDVSAATEHGVLVVNTPGRNAVAVAELTFCLMLTLARRVHEAAEFTRSGAWNSPLCAVHWGGAELAHKSLGLVGLGAVGREVAHRASAFGMQVLAYDPYVSTHAEPTVEFTSLSDLLARSDIVSIHCAATPETRRMVGADELALMKPTAFLVNTARAEIVDEEALVAVLLDGRIAGAALDVFSVEPLPPRHTLLGIENVILTPHIGGSPDDVVRRHSWMVAQDLIRWKRGERPEHLINVEAWLDRECGR